MDIILSKLKEATLSGGLRQLPVLGLDLGGAGGMAGGAGMEPRPPAQKP